MSPPAIDALLALARRAAGGPAAFEAGALPDQLVRSHGLAPLAARMGEERFRADLAASALRVPVLESVASAAIASLAAAGIPVALIKGCSYAASIYDHPSERPMTDVDLLVSGNRFPEACRRLADVGLSPRASPPLLHARTFAGRGAEVDLHRAIVPAGWARVDEEAVWARARPARERGDGALRLDPVDEALFQCLVLVRGFWGRLLGYVDAARLLSRLDGGETGQLLARARSWRVARATAAALTVTARIAGTGPPPGTPALRYPLPGIDRIAAGQRPGRLGRALHRLGLSDGPRQAAGQLTYYAMRAAGHAIQR